MTDTVAQATPRLTPAHYTKLPPVLPEHYRLAELPETERVARLYVANKWLTSPSKRCPRARVLRQISAKLAPDGSMTSEARWYLLEDSERLEFYRRTLRYLGFTPPPWTANTFSPGSGDKPVGILPTDDAECMADLGPLLLARDGAERAAHAEPTSLAHKDRVAAISRQIDSVLAAAGYATPSLISDRSHTLGDDSQIINKDTPEHD